MTYYMMFSLFQEQIYVAKRCLMNGKFLKNHVYIFEVRDIMFTQIQMGSYDTLPH